METSILVSVKKNLGIEADYDAFDHDVITFTNTAFSTLNQLGVGPDNAFVISDETALWSQFLSGATFDNQLSNVRTYIYLRVRLMFDPPTSSYALKSFEDQINELEFRLSTDREGREWVDPLPPAEVNCE